LKDNRINFVHFLTQNDTVELFLFGMLIFMAMASWYFIVIKAWQARLVDRCREQFG